MQDKETLFKQSLNCKFDTPKKLNRADKAIPSEVIEQLESGQFTCEMIDQLKKQYPIFFYQTCVTIHGQWGNVERSYIGGYKHIHQNQNGSLEVFYPCIDLEKIKTIIAGLRAIDSKAFYYQSNSTARAFTMSQTITKDNAPELKAKFLQIADRLKSLRIYGSVHIYIQPKLWGGAEIVCRLYPCAIPESEVNNVLLCLANMTQTEYDRKVIEVKQAREVEARRRKAEDEARTTERNAKREQTMAIYREQFKPLMETLPICNDINAGILVKPIIDLDKITFTYYRLDGKGSFNRVKWSKAYSKELCTDASQIEFMEQKQQKISDFRLNDFRLLQPVKQVEAPKVQPKRETAPQPKQTTTGVILVDYSDKAIALFGDTKPIKDKLAAIGGRFNPYLKREGATQAGWIFSKSKQSELNQLITN